MGWERISERASIMLRTEPKVSVLIPTFNRAKYLPRCLDSIFSQTLRPHQVIVVNDGSTDETHSVIRPYQDKVDYVEMENGGKSGAVNRGLSEAVGDYVWIFDDDDVAFPDAIERLVAPLVKYSEYGFSFGSRVIVQGGEDVGQLGDIVKESEIPDLETKGPLIPLLEACYLGGASLLARKACYDLVGGYDTDLVRSQDYEMAIRLTRSFKGVRVPGGPIFYACQHPGPRGCLRDRFPAGQMKRKWLQYGQGILRKLRNELPLTEYLPPGMDLKENRRQAILQRLAIMVSRLLAQEAIADLEELKQLNDQRPFNEMERTIIANLVVRTPWYQTGKLIETSQFQAGLNRILFPNQDADSGFMRKMSDMKHANRMNSDADLFGFLLAFVEPVSVIELLLSLVRSRGNALT